MKLSSFFLCSVFLISQALMAQTGSIGGVVFNDLNGNGVNDGKAGIAGVTVFLDLNNNRILDGGEPSDTTDATGLYDITSLAAGLYQVRVDETTIVGLGTTTFNIPLEINLFDGEDLNTADFGFQAETPQIGIAKDQSNIGRQVTLDFYLENLGNTTLNSFVLDDDLDTVFGAGNYTLIMAPTLLSGPTTIVPNASFDGSTDIALIASGFLEVGMTVQIRVVVEITAVVDQGFGLGTYNNQVTVMAQSNAGTMTSDPSDSGTDPDPNGNGDPGDAGEDDVTVIAILQNPRIGVAKAASLSGSQVTMDFYLENFGNVALNNVSLTDDLDAVFGAGNYSVISAPVFIDNPGTITLNGAFNGGTMSNMITSGTLALNDTAQIRVVVDITNVTDQGMGLGVYNNQATAGGDAPNGNPASDLSDEGIDPDPDGDGNPSGVGEADPTVIVIGEEPVIGVAKDASVTGSAVTVDFYLENLGNTTLSNLSLTDDLNAAFGMGNYFISTAPSFIDDPGTVTLNGAYDGNFNTQLLNTAASTLTAGDTAQIRMVVNILQLADLGMGLGIYTNQAFAFAQAPGGATTQDDSDNGTDPDPDGNGDPTDAGENDVTPITVAPANVIGISKEFVLDALIGGFPQITLRFIVTNYGNQTLSNISVSDDLNAVYGAGNYLHTNDPTFVTGSPTLTYNSAFNGGSNTTMVTGGTLAPGDSATFLIGHRLINQVDQGFGIGIYQNQVTVIATDPSAGIVSDLSHEGDNADPNGNGDPTEAGENDPTVINVLGVSAIGIAKDAMVAGNLVTLDFYLENLGTTQLNNIGIEERLDPVFGAGNYTITSPPAFVVDPGTLTLDAGFDGMLNDEILNLAASSLASGALAQIRMVVRVDRLANQGLGLGNYSNQVIVNAQSPQATLVSDISDSGTDPDPNGNGNANEGGENDATLISLAVSSPIGIAKNDGISGSQITYDLFLENHGAGTLSMVSVTEDLDSTFGAGNYAIITPPSLIVDPGTLVLNGAFNGGTDPEILGAASTLNGGATAQIQFVVDVTSESDQGSGFGIYNNQAIAAGTQADGLRVSDFSDDGTDPDPSGNNDPSDAGEDDPTTSVVAGNPAIGIAKKAYVDGTQVIFDFYIENLGDVTLTNLIMRDQLNPVFGNGNYNVGTQPMLVNGPGTLIRNTNFFGFSVFDVVVGGGFLRPGETEHIRVIINVTTVADVGNGFGIYFNSVDISATGPDGTPVMDTSDDGTDPDPNGNGNAGDAGEDDATRIEIGDENRIGVAKTASVIGQQVTFDLYLENFGASVLSSLALAEDFDAVFGAGNYSLNGSPSFLDDPGTITLNPGFDGSGTTALFSAGSTLAGTDTAQIQIVVDVTNIVDQGLGQGNYTNQVSITGTAPGGSLAEDTSDNGTTPDPNGNGLANDAGEDDLTPFAVGFTQVGVAKNATVSGNLVTLDYYVENLGDVMFNSVSLPDDLDAVFGAGNYILVSGPDIVSAPRALVANTNFDGSTDTELIASGTLGLGVTEQFQIVVDVINLIDGGSGLGVYSNQVTVTADAESDLSDSGTDPDPNGNGLSDDAGEDDPTVFTVAEDPRIGAAKTVSVVGRTVTVDLYLESFANVLSSNVSLLEDLDTVFGAGNYTISSAPALIDDPGTLNLNGGFDGSGSPDILAAGSTLVIGDTAQIQFEVTVTTVTDQGFGFGTFQNQATVSAQSPDSTMISDASDDGMDPDPNGNDDPTDADEDDPSVIVLRGSIGDFVWNDLNGDGVQDGGEPGLDGITVFLDLNTNGAFDGGEPFQVTAGGGAFDFTDLAAGNYTVEILASTIPVGFNLTTANLPFSEMLLNGEDVDNADFGYQQQDASIGDFVWNDLNGDGVQDGGEPGMSGVTVFLDLNTNGMLDGGEPSQVTDGAGAYDFTALATGTYDVTVDPATVTAGFVLTGGSSPLTVNLAAGEDFNDADFGYQQQDASIGDFVWNDLNGDGVQDGGEPGLSGVTVFLDFNTNGMLDGGEPSDTTDAAGAYDMTNLPTGTYEVTVAVATLPVGFVLTGGSSPLTVNLAAGEDFNDADFGYQQQDASIGDFVWNDLNGDGVQDGGEPGLAGVTVFLDLNTNGMLDGGEPSDTTDAAGAYDMTNLPTGTYEVTVAVATLPVGFVLTGGSSPLTVNLAAGQDFNDADFGYQQQNASIGDFVWNDLNGDGVQDGGEPGLAGVTVFLDLNSNGSLDGGEPSQVTDGAGAYDFTGLATGSYDATVDPATVTAGFVLTGGSSPLTVNLAAGEDFNDADFGYQQQDASIGDFVWNDLNGDGVQDGGEPGLPGVTVFLDLNSNGMLDGGEPSQATDGAGAYDFTALATGSYDVTVDPATVTAGFVLTGGSSPLTVNLAAGEDFNDADFGYQQQDASIGDFVWNDLNGDGVQDGGEPGLDNVTLDLINDLNGNGVIDGGEPVLSTQTTAGGGAYDFTALAMGNYLVNVTDTNGALTGDVLTGGSNPLAVVIAAGQDFNDADFGYQRQDGSVGDFVWNDLNGDGVQDAGEPGLANVTLDLINDLNSNGVIDGGEPVIDTQTTGAAGDYDFTGLAVGSYIVNVTDTNGALTGDILTGGSNPLAVSLVKGADVNDADFGYQRQDGTIGDFVWNDLNGDGVQDAGEPGLANVTLDLINDLNGNGAIDAGDPVLSTMTTGGAGDYDFPGLAVGDYIVNVTDTNGALTGDVLTGGVNPFAVSLAKGADINNADFGYQRQESSIGDFVWNDLNGDGVQDAGEPGLDNVTIDLIDDLNGNGVIDAGEPVRATQTTAGGGAYDFTSLPAATYLVNVTDVNGALTGDVLTGGTNPLPVNLLKGQDFDDADFGYQRQDGTIGDFVWNDLNGDGVQDAGEPGVGNITLDLIDDLNSNGTIDAGEPVLATQTTGAAGDYDFTALAVGDYIVNVTDTNGVLGGDVLTGGTNPLAVSLAKGADFNDADFGYQLQNSVIGDLVWHDYDGNGLVDAGEPGLENVSLDLIGDTNGNGAIDAGEPVLDTQTTDMDGLYQFENLATGNYIVNVTDTNGVLTGFELTVGDNPRAVALAKGEENLTVDFAYLDTRARIGVSLAVEVFNIVDSRTKRGHNNVFAIDFMFRVENFGTVDLTDLSMVEDLAAVFNPTVFEVQPIRITGGNASSVNVNGSWDGSSDTEMFAPGSSLAPGEFTELEFQVVLPDAPEPMGMLVSFENQVRVTAIGISGNPVFDDSEDGDNPDANGNGNPGDDSNPTIITLPLTVPTLGTWGLITFLALLGGVAMWLNRRNRQNQPLTGGA